MTTLTQKDLIFGKKIVNLQWGSSSLYDPKVSLHSFVLWKFLSVRFLILQARLDPLENAPLKLVCQATAAAPTYLPPVHFKLTNSTTDASREFNLIDGGVAVNNPVTCGFWSFILFYFGFYFGGGLFRAQTDHKFSSGQTNPKWSSNILALKLVDHFKLDFEQITFPFYVTMLSFHYKIFLNFWTKVWCHPSLILIDFEHSWMNASSLFPDAWLSEDIGRTWQVSFSLEPEGFQFFAQKSFLAWKLWQTYVAITQAIKEVQSGGKAAGRVTFTVSDSWL